MAWSNEEVWVELKWDKDNTLLQRTTHVKAHVHIIYSVSTHTHLQLQPCKDAVSGYKAALFTSVKSFIQVLFSPELAHFSPVCPVWVTGFNTRQMEWHNTTKAPKSSFNTFHIPVHIMFTLCIFFNQLQTKLSCGFLALKTEASVCCQL